LIFELKTLLLIRRMSNIRLIMVLVFHSNLFVFDKNLLISHLSFLSSLTFILRMYHLAHPIIIAHDVTIADYRDTHMLLEIIDPGQIRSTSEGLLVRPPMYRDQICSGVLESLHEVDEETRILPTETSLHRYWYRYRIRHLLDDPKCCISVDHE
jgi:hypothetical protein